MASREHTPAGDDPFHAPASFAGPDATTWRRDAYKVALIGPECTPHLELIERSGYQVVSAADGDAASDLFGRGEAVDVIVLDFGAEGRPPEAVLLFARRTSAGAALIALVPAQKNEAYRRAFLAGARDVLPAPARGEDLLASVDLVLEPRGLADVVEELRAQSFEDEGTLPIESLGDPALKKRIAQLELQLRQKTEELDRMEERRKTGTASFRQQALDAITERDKAFEGRERAKQKLTVARRELKEREAQLRLTERACEELNTKLRQSREDQRLLENRLVELAQKAKDLERLLEAQAGATSPHPRAQGPGDGEQTTRSPDPVVLDPEEALEAREQDALALEEIEEIWVKYQESLRTIRELEAALENRTEPGRHLDAVAAADPADALAAREEDAATLAQLEVALEERESLRGRIEVLETQLKQRDAELRAAAAVDLGEGTITLEVALAELDSLREAQAEALGTLDAIRADRDAIRHRLIEAEREAADALTRLEDLGPVAEEVERLRRELHAEQQSHMATRARLTSVELASAHPPIGSEPSDEGGEEGSRPSGAWRTADQLQFELDRAQAQLAQTLQDTSDLEERLIAQEAELNSLRVMVAALTRDRSGEGSLRPGPADRDSWPRDG